MLRNTRLNRRKDLQKNMMNSSNLTEQQIASIADVLANCHDWDTASLSKEAEQVLELGDGSLMGLLKDYLNIDPRVRLAPDFDHRKFILEFQFRDFN